MFCWTYSVHKHNFMLIPPRNKWSVQTLQKYKFKTIQRSGLKSESLQLLRSHTYTHTHVESAHTCTNTQNDCHWSWSTVTLVSCCLKATHRWWFFISLDKSKYIIYRILTQTFLCIDYSYISLYWLLIHFSVLTTHIFLCIGYSSISSSSYFSTLKYDRILKQMFSLTMIYKTPKVRNVWSTMFQPCKYVNIDISEQQYINLRLGRIVFLYCHFFKHKLWKLQKRFP